MLVSQGMATLYARIPDALYERFTTEAQQRGLSLTATAIVLLEAALNRADRERTTRDNRADRRYPDA